MTTIKAHFDGITIVPDEPVDLPVNQPLILRVDQPAAPLANSHRQEMLEQLDALVALADDSAPEADWSRDSI